MLTDLLAKLPSVTMSLGDFTLNALANAFGTIVGGFILTILYYILGARLFKLPNLNGLWMFKSTYARTKYNPYRNMELIYKVHLLQEGNRVHGSAEKVFERSDKERVYAGADRQPVSIEGTVQKGYFGRSQVFLHMTLQGELRQSSGYALLNCRGVFSKFRLEGLVSMTAGDSYGPAVCLPIPINLAVDEYKGPPIKWIGRVIDLVAGHFYKEDWKKVDDGIRSAQGMAKFVWRTFNCHPLIAALVLAEDHRYYKHGGVDPIGILRALWRACIGQSLEGASTIEQQFVRVTTGDYRRSFARKFKEIILAARLYRIADKETIAVHYLLVSYCGWRMTGMLRSARRLGIDLKQPTLANAAAIVARIKYPHPHAENSERLRKISERERFILSKLEARRYLTF